MYILLQFMDFSPVEYLREKDWHLINTHAHGQTLPHISHHAFTITKILKGSTTDLMHIHT